MYDVIVIGARSAGAATAMLLVRKGLRVLLLDRATFPSDTPSGHYIHQTGVARLARWGLLNRVIASGCPPARSTTLDVEPFALTGGWWSYWSGVPASGIAFYLRPNRAVGTFATDEGLTGVFTTVPAAAAAERADFAT